MKIKQEPVFDVSGNFEALVGARAYLRAKRGEERLLLLLSRIADLARNLPKEAVSVADDYRVWCAQQVVRMVERGE